MALENTKRFWDLAHAFSGGQFIILSRIPMLTEAFCVSGFLNLSAPFRFRPLPIYPLGSSKSRRSTRVPGAHVVLDRGRLASLTPVA